MLNFCNTYSGIFRLPFGVQKWVTTQQYHNINIMTSIQCIGDTHHQASSWASSPGERAGLPLHWTLATEAMYVQPSQIPGLLIWLTWALVSSAPPQSLHLPPMPTSLNDICFLLYHSCKNISPILSSISFHDTTAVMSWSLLQSFPKLHPSALARHP